MTAQQILFKTASYNLSGNCPFFDPAHATCRAARLSFTPDGRHLYSYCCSDDYDDCALFLVKALRSSALGGHARDVAAYSEK